MVPALAGLTGVSAEKIIFSLSYVILRKLLFNLETFVIAGSRPWIGISPLQNGHLIPLAKI
jgi:hypothetical protein